VRAVALNAHIRTTQNAEQPSQLRYFSRNKRGRGKASLLAVIGAFLLFYKTVASEIAARIVVKVSRRQMNSGVDGGTDGVRGISWGGAVALNAHIQTTQNAEQPSHLRYFSRNKWDRGKALLLSVMGALLFYKTSHLKLQHG
jgi:hypothetical protein